MRYTLILSVCLALLKTLSFAFNTLPELYASRSSPASKCNTVICSSSSKDYHIDDPSAPREDPASLVRITSWSSSWFPLAYTAFMDKTRPSKHYLLGAPIVVWHHDNTWHAMLDRCPHRLVPLSEGRVVPSTGDIECPYHGFTFDGKTGQCTRIPQAQVNTTLVGLDKRGCASALSCAVQQGIIWVHSAPLYGNTTYTPNPAELGSYNIEPIDLPGVLHVDYFRDLPMDWDTLAENVLDPAHLPFTHHKTISSRTKAVPVPIKLTGYSDNGFTAQRLTDPPGAVEFRAPHLIYSRTSRQDSFIDWNVVYAIPTMPGHCRLLVRVVFEVSAMKPPLKYIFGIVFRQPKFLLHLSNHKILEDDNVFLHHQGHNYRQLEESFEKGTYLPTSADRAVIAFQRWLKDFDYNRKWSPHTPPGAFARRDEVLTRDELITRGHTHTDHCTSCLRAKQWLERMEPTLGVGAVVCAVRAFGGSSVRWPMGVVAGVLYWLKRKAGDMLRNMQDGEWPPPRNR